MSKSNEELNELKKEVETLNKKLQELTEEELAPVTGGYDPAVADQMIKKKRDELDTSKEANPVKVNESYGAFMRAHYEN